MLSEAAWPAVSTEALTWESAHLELVPRRHRAAMAAPYHAVITPAIAEVDTIPSSTAMSADLADAEREIVRFDQAIGAGLEAFAVVALRTEAAASSQIENLTASASAIAVAEHAERTASPIRDNAAIIADNVATLTAALDRDRDLDAAEIVELQRVLLEPSAPHLTGDFRHEQVWVGGTQWSPHGADHVAPHHQRVPAAIDDLVAFIARDDLPALAQIAVAHAQFETIHPFPDGNGRTGRVIVQRMLRRSGLSREALLPLSAGLLSAIDEYFAALKAYQHGEVEPILTAFVDAAFAAMGNAKELADDLVEISARWRDEIKARRDSKVWLALDACIARPAVTAPMLGDLLGTTPATVYRLIGQLEEAGVLRQNSKARRNRVWLVGDVIDAVEAFQERSIRRAPS